MFKRTFEQKANYCNIRVSNWSLLKSGAKAPPYWLSHIPIEFSLYGVFFMGNIKKYNLRLNR